MLNQAEAWAGSEYSTFLDEYWRLKKTRFRPQSRQECYVLLRNSKKQNNLPVNRVANQLQPKDCVSEIHDHHTKVAQDLISKIYAQLQGLVPYFAFIVVKLQLLNIVIIH